MILKNRDTQEEYNSILDCLEQTEEKYRYKTAVSDTKLSLTWHELAVMARKIGSGLSRLVPPGSPVPVFMEKSSVTLAAMFGAVYAGCFYVPVNPDNPGDRLKKIFQTLEAETVIADENGKRLLESAGLLADGKLELHRYWRKSFFSRRRMRRCLRSRTKRQARSAVRAVYIRFPREIRRR